MPLRRCLHFISGAGLIVVVALSACQFQTISQLQSRQWMMDREGFASPRVDGDLQISCSPPSLWEMLPRHRTLLYTHQQWRSPDRLVGMGVAHLTTPIPLSAQMIVWLAKQQYSATESAHPRHGHLIGEWTDSLGRAWFEAENDMYHVTGCAMTHGFDAWIIYSGYRVNTHAKASEIVLAARAADTVVPLSAR